MNQSECQRPGRRRGPLLVLLAALLVAFPLAACSDPEKAKAEHISRGESLLKERKFQEAALEFRNAIQIDENAAAAYWGLARAYEGTGQYVEAMGALQRTVALDQNNLDARTRLGNYYLIGFQQTKNAQYKDEARKLADEVLQRDPNHIEGHVLRGSLLFADGDRAGALEVVEAARSETPGGLKGILESGSLGDRVREAADDALGAGADCVKTSTGKVGQGASPEAARAMLEAIKDRGEGGFKASGGVRTPDDAQRYLDLADELLGPEWATPTTFRIGASTLLDALLEQ